MDIHPFSPRAVGSVTITAGTSSAAVALPCPGSGRYVLYNAGSVPVMIEFGAGSVAAVVATGYPLGPGMKETLSVPTTATHIATISGSASQTVYVSAGTGL